MLFGNTDGNKRILTMKMDLDGGMKYDKELWGIVMLLHLLVQWLPIHNTSRICSFKKPRTSLVYTQLDFISEANLT